MLDKSWAPKPLSLWLCRDSPAKISAKKKKDMGCSWMVWARGREAGWNVPFVVAWIKRSLKEDYWLEQISWLFYLEKSKASFLYGLSSTHWPVELEGILNQLGCHAPNFQSLPGLIGCIFLKIGESIDLEYRGSSSVVKPHIPPNFITCFRK